MDRRAAPGSLLRSFERHLRAQNRSERTVGNYLENARRAEAFLEGRGKRLEEATQADLEDFLGDILRGLYRWLAEEEELPKPDGADAPADRPRAARPDRPRRRPTAAAERLRRQ